MVKDIEELSSELNPHSFRHIGSLEHGKVEVVDAGSTKNGIDSRLRSGTEVRRCGEATGVEPLSKVLAACFSVTSGDDIRTDVRDAKVCRYERSRAGIRDLQRETALEGRNSINSPTRHGAIGEARQVVGESLAATEGEIENVADHESL